ncbi:MAG TPA: hypothetical protein VEH27_19295 [Methylomirabilota bacterium]|nr:hypothetical protein [Methylomirabilota bacterium]
MRLFLKASTSVLLLGAAVHAATPTVTSVSPKVLPLGRATRVEISGSDLAGPSLWLNFPASTRWLDTNDAMRVACEITPENEAGIGAFRVFSTNGVSALQLLAVVRTSGNTTIHEGVIREEGANFHHRVMLKKGERIVAEVIANRLGSTLDPVVRLLDSAHKLELAFNDDFTFGGRDARVSFVAPKEAEYVIELRDVAYTGSDKHRYQLLIGNAQQPSLPWLSPGADPNFPSESEPNNAPEQANTLATHLRAEFALARDKDLFRIHVAEKGKLLVKSASRSIGSPCDVRLRLIRADQSVVAFGTVPHTEDTFLKADVDAGEYLLEATELTGKGAPGLHYQLSVQAWLPSFTLTTETDSISPAGGDTITIPVKAQRVDFDGEITLAVAGLPRGVEVDGALIPAKKSEAELKLKFPSTLPVGVWNELRISGSAKWQERQLTAVASTRLALKKAFPLLHIPESPLTSMIPCVIKAK